MIRLIHSHVELPGTWRRLLVLGERLTAISCENCGTVTILRDTEIIHRDRDFEVCPSLVCGHELDGVKLEGWDYDHRGSPDDYPFVAPPPNFAPKKAPTWKTRAERRAIKAAKKVEQRIKPSPRSKSKRKPKPLIQLEL